ncbi:hypothetical protein scyTo_0021150, partial [Scyliorhinus torazame]|nr:hypothetical protein [Scyliorhinus torazame]
SEAARESGPVNGQTLAEAEGRRQPRILSFCT